MKSVVFLKAMVSVALFSYSLNAVAWRLFCCTQSCIKGQLNQTSETTEPRNITYLHSIETNYDSTLERLSSLGLEQHVFVGSAGFFIIDAASINQTRDFERDHIFLFHPSGEVAFFWREVIFQLLRENDRKEDFINLLVAELLENSARYCNWPSSTGFPDPERELANVREVLSPEIYQLILEKRNIQLGYEIEKLCYRMRFGMSFLSIDGEQNGRYSYVHNLARSNRIHFFRGDVSKDDQFQILKNEIDATNEEVGMLYLTNVSPDQAAPAEGWATSNSEEYADFLEHFHSQIRSIERVNSGALVVTSHPRIVSRHVPLRINSNDGHQEVLINILSEYYVWRPEDMTPQEIRQNYPALPDIIQREGLNIRLTDFRQIKSLI